MTKVNLNKIKPKDRQAMLAMARGLARQGYVRHAIAAYEALIQVFPESKEADRAESALIKIAKTYS